MTKRKLLAKTLYTYVEPRNNHFVRTEYKKLGYKSYSAFVNALITWARTGRAASKRILRKSA